MKNTDDTPRILPSEITPREKYLNRREVVAAMGLLPFGLAPSMASASLGDAKPWPGSLIEKPTPSEKAFSHNNFYELGPRKTQPAERADYYQAKPWKVMIDGEVEKPGEYDVDVLLGLAPQEERIYRLRCVEAWSMVIPWIGYPFSKLIEEVRPTGNAKYVAFQTFNPEELFPNKTNRSLPWPYVEGLRIDEAAHDLTLLTFGMYGEELPNQNGAPVRMVVPWKYGYKSIKALVRISFVEDQPPTSWNESQPSEYGFYSNVNPEVSHPRWSQARERAIGEGFFPTKRDTQMFNGYLNVASLYEGMDLRVNH